MAIPAEFQGILSHPLGASRGAIAHWMVEAQHLRLRSPASDPEGLRRRAMVLDSGMLQATPWTLCTFSTRP